MEEKQTKICPYCRQLIPADAQKCKYCGEWIKEKPQESNGLYSFCSSIVFLLNILISIAVINTTQSLGAGFVTFIFVLICFLIYFLPTIIADNKRHKNTTAICVVNIFFGWSIIGWVICLVWALIEEH